MKDTQTITASDVATLDVVMADVEAPKPHSIHARSKVVYDVDLLCAHCQRVTKQKASRIKDPNGNHELNVSCDCGRCLKFALFHPPNECAKCKGAAEAAGVPFTPKHKVTVKEGTASAKCACGESLTVEATDLDALFKSHNEHNVGKVSAAQEQADDAEWDTILKTRLK